MSTYPLCKTGAIALLAISGLASLCFGQTSPAPASAPALRTTAAISAPAPKPLINYFLPTPIMSPLAQDVWGAANVLPRDANNGLEDHTMMKNWCYWDGQIIKAKDGKYHMFASRWDQAKGHLSGWPTSSAIHAVSDSLYGPYVDKGMMWPEDQGGKGHNVTALQLPNDEGYAVIISETRPGTVYTSKSLDGPLDSKKALIKVDGQPNWKASNVTIMLRPDGDFEIVQRSGILMISKAADGILGPYKVQGASAFPGGIRNLEDPFIFYAGGLYHITVNSWSTRKAYHLTSEDGISNWKNLRFGLRPRCAFRSLYRWHRQQMEPHGTPRRLYRKRRGQGVYLCRAGCAKKSGTGQRHPWQQDHRGSLRRRKVQH